MLRLEGSDSSSLNSLLCGLEREGAKGGDRRGGDFIFSSARVILGLFLPLFNSFLADRRLMGVTGLRSLASNRLTLSRLLLFLSLLPTRSNVVSVLLVRARDEASESKVTQLDNSSC